MCLLLYCSLLCSVIFFFKQKTAYEMRISDWSSDVCSSDLAAILGQLVEPLDGVLRLDLLALLLELQAVARAPLLDLLPPGLQRLLVELQLACLPGRQQVLQHRAGVADNRQVDHHVLVDRGGVDVDVDLLGARRELVEA